MKNNFFENANENVGKPITGQPLDPEVFWNTNEGLIKEGLETYLRENVFSNYDVQSELCKERLNKALKVEKDFLSVLLETLKKSLEVNKKIVMLFDVDETIGQGFYDNEGGAHTFIRPSFVPFLNNIKTSIENGKVNIGLITTRGPVKEQLEDKEHLMGIKGFVNPDYVYSTRDANFHVDRSKDNSEIIKGFETGKDTILNLEAVENEGYTGSAANLSKLLILKNLRTLYPDTLFIVVDDARYPKCLDEKKGFIGIELKNESFLI